MQTAKDYPQRLTEKVEKMIEDGFKKKERWGGMHKYMQEMELAVTAMLATDRSYNLSISLIDRMMSSYVRHVDLRKHLYSLE